MEVRNELKYTEDHEWVLIDGDTVVMGITDFAQNSLGDIVYIEMPEVGTIVDTGEAIGNIESVKAVSEIYCPISGEITDVNKDLEEQPELTNTSPYD
ncbi:MAG: glycine cleavage system protein GcvH, partial [Deltaproteobacteria bacterium]|nr:glycine cleavage system protein GcvH [Deltaproteobacteria bacterium]